MRTAAHQGVAMKHTRTQRWRSSRAGEMRSDSATSALRCGLAASSSSGHSGRTSANNNRLPATLPGQCLPRSIQSSRDSRWPRRTASSTRSPLS